MKKILIITLLLLLFCLTGCREDKDVTAKEVADTIADISSDKDGNVTITLVNGKTFLLGNLKGEKGEKGDPGKDGKDGVNGKNGLDGKNGANGRDGADGLSANISNNYITKVSIEASDKLFTTNSDGTKTYIDRVKTIGKHKLTPVYHFGNSDVTESSEDDSRYYWADEGDQIDVWCYPYSNGSSEVFDINQAKFKIKKCVIEGKEYTPTAVGKDYAIFSIDSVPGHDCQVHFVYDKFSGIYVPKKDVGYDYIYKWYLDYDFMVDYFIKVDATAENPAGTFTLKRTSDRSIVPHESLITDFSTDAYFIEYYEQKAQVSITIPSANASRSEVENWANRYDFINFTTESTYDIPLIDTFRVIDNQGYTLSPDSVIVVTNSDLQFFVTYYVEKEHILTISPASSQDKKTLSLFATFDEGSSWDSWSYSDGYSGLSFSESNEGNSKVLTISSSDEAISATTFTVKAKTNKKEASVTITVKDDLTLEASY